MNETFFPTSIKEIGEEMNSSTLADSERLEELIAQNERLQAERSGFEAEIARLNERYSSALSEINDYRLKIANASGVIMDYYSENGELTDELKQIGEMLGTEMTKNISGTALFEISWSAQVPLDFDPDDFEISFSAECESYEADDFDWQEENSEVNAEDDY